MHSVPAARALVLASSRPLGSETIALRESVGRYLSAPLRAVRDVPAFACSAMDGWAVRASEATAGARLAMGPRLFAGDLPVQPLQPGHAARIFTGAPLPSGADAVVREEVVVEKDGAVEIQQAAVAGDHLRPAGEDVAAGAVALDSGTRLGARQLGLCAALGAERVEVVKRPRVMLIATGDEIVRGLVPDSNGQALQAALRALGCEVESAIVGDDREAISGAIARGLAAADVVITTAGVSIGEKDFVARALAAVGAQVAIHGVAMKPGKPFLFATASGRPIFGLPGSPSACLVAYEVFVRPFLLTLCGARVATRRSLPLPLGEKVSGRPGRARFVWARLDGQGRVTPLGQDVAQIRGPALADVLLALPEDAGELPEGALAEAWLLEEAAP